MFTFLCPIKDGPPAFRAERDMIETSAWCSVVVYGQRFPLPICRLIILIKIQNSTELSHSVYEETDKTVSSSPLNSLALRRHSEQRGGWLAQSHNDACILDFLEQQKPPGTYGTGRFAIRHLFGARKQWVFGMSKCVSASFGTKTHKHRR